MLRQPKPAWIIECGTCDAEFTIHVPRDKPQEPTIAEIEAAFATNVSFPWQWDNATGIAKCYDCQENEKRYPREDWQYEVANGDTKLGYEDWLAHKLEMEDAE